MKIYVIEFKRKNHDNWIELNNIYKSIDDAKKTIKGMEYEDFKAHDEGGYEYRIIERDFKMNVTLTNTKIDDKIEI